MQNYYSEVEDYEKKKKFFDEAYDALTAQELKNYKKIIATYKNRLDLAHKLRKQIKEVEAQCEANDKSLRKTFTFFVVLGVIAILAKIANDYNVSDLSAKLISDMGFGFLILTGVVYYLWLSLINKLSNQNMTLNISNTNLAITVLETAYSDCGLMNFPNTDDYNKIFDNSFRSDKLSEAELHIVKEFNVQLGLSALESMGHDVPLIWR